MLVDLGLEALENIVSDGVKEMMAHIGGGKNNNGNKSVWVKAVKTALKEYQQRIKEDFLPVLVNDFGRKLEVKFSGGKMNEEEITKLKMFLDMVEKSSIKHIEQELVKKLEGIKVDDENVELKHKFENTRRMIEEGHQWIFNRVELHIRNVLSILKQFQV